jgi:fumarate reductase subunit D
MIIKTILLICAAVTLVFGLGYMFLPVQTLKLLGYQTDTTGRLFLQFIGVLSMGYVAAVWQVRNASQKVQKPTILSAFVAMGFAFLISLINQLTSTLGAIGWLTVAMFGLAFGVFGYFWIIKFSK